MNRFYARRFLNSPGHHAGAYVLAVVEQTRSDDADPYPEIFFELADCSRHVALDFPLTTASSRRNSVRKARLLADAATRFADALEAEADAIAERRRRPVKRS
ncbi:MAG: hypothetical protein ACRDY6_16990 [Acidimicrobiia bacterium]